MVAVSVLASQASAAQVASSNSAAVPDRAKLEREAKNWETLHKLYPKQSLAAGEQGLVGFLIGIDAAGSPTKCQITHTSGYKTLDEETCKLIMVHATFKRPAGLSLSQERTYEGVVNWKLPSTPLAAVPEIPKPVLASAAPEPQICKRTVRVGTLAGFERTCMTQREWDKATQDTQDYWNDLQGRKGSSRCPPGSESC
ncbi:energy transducer TonB [Sphingomonas lutea]|uniref:energy transducer TonB n=1 Tax=Sphingomonas lutea TaxID=1045317 RepID=UPI001F2554B3|nr:energy transducer TonB [Sphingomonas lutea]